MLSGSHFNTSFDDPDMISVSQRHWKVECYDFYVLCTVNYQLMKFRLCVVVTDSGESMPFLSGLYLEMMHFRTQHFLHRKKSKGMGCFSKAIE